MLSSSALLCGILAAVSSNAQLPPSQDFTHQTHLDPNSDVFLAWQFDDTHITFEMQAKTTGWVGIGISPSGSMANADINVGWVKDGVAKVTERHGTDSNDFPPLDVVANVELLGGSECDGWTTIKFRRQLAACDSEDQEITTDTVKMIYAWGLDDPAGDDITHQDYHQTKRGTLSMLLLNQANSGDAALPGGEIYLQTDLLNDNFAVPAVKTYYNCRFLKMPVLTAKHHIVKIEPIIQKGNELNVHHMILYGCSSPDLDDSSVGLNTRCQGSDMPPDFAGCSFMMHGWNIGGGAFYYPNHAGYPIGTADSPKYVVVEIHYDNPLIKDDIVDSSGLRLVYTPDLRTFDAGIMEVGVGVSGLSHVIPPNAESFTSYGECPTACFDHVLDSAKLTSINLFAVLLHGHLLPTQLTLKHVRNGVELQPLAADKSYDFNFQETRFLREERVVKNGDTLQMVCNYDTTEMTGITVGGLDTTKEMCTAFVFFYPKLALSFCESTPDFDTLMNYFGFTSYKQIRNDSWSYLDLNDYMILEPEEYADKTAMENLNSLPWDKAMLAELEENARKMQSYVFCYPVTDLEEQLITPIEIREPHVDEMLECTAPSSGFPQSGAMAECPSDAPVVTTSGSEKFYVHFFGFYVVCIATFLSLLMF